MLPREKAGAKALGQVYLLLRNGKASDNGGEYGQSGLRSRGPQTRCAELVGCGKTQDVIEREMGNHVSALSRGVL